VLRAVKLLGGDELPAEEAVELADVRESAEGLAASEEELLLLALFGEAAEPLLQAIRGRGQRPDSDLAGLEPVRAERIREVVRIVQESGVNEVTIEDGGLRVTVRRGDERAAAPAVPSSDGVADELPLSSGDPPPRSSMIRVEAPMVGTFYRARDPLAPPFVNEGDVVVAGQTLCILEAMKLMNEIKSEVEGQVTSILVENAQPVEYGQLLFELEPVDGRPPAF
jgi:oxaloacetate decarboxylase alpha subunit